MLALIVCLLVAGSRIPADWKPGAPTDGLMLYTSDFHCDSSTTGASCSSSLVAEGIEVAIISSEPVPGASWVLQVKPNQFNTENVQSWLNTYEYVAVDEITWPLAWSDSFAEDPIAVLQNLAGTQYSGRIIFFFNFSPGNPNLQQDEIQGILKNCLTLCRKVVIETYSNGAIDDIQDWFNGAAKQALSQFNQDYMGYNDISTPCFGISPDVGAPDVLRVMQALSSMFQIQLQTQGGWRGSAFYDPVSVVTASTTGYNVPALVGALSQLTNQYYPASA